MGQVDYGNPYNPRNARAAGLNALGSHFHNRRDQLTELTRNGFEAADYLGDWDKEPKFDRFEELNGTMVLGDSLFPMLYIYEMGDRKMVKPSYGMHANVSELNKGMREHLRASFTSATLAYSSEDKDLETGEPKNMTSSDIDEKVDHIMEIIDSNITKLYKLMIGAVNKNKLYYQTLCAEVNKLKARYQRELPAEPFSYGNYHEERETNKTAGFIQQHERLPIIAPERHAGSFGQAIEMLRILFEAGIIKYDFKLEVRPIDINTGEFAVSDETDEFGTNMAKWLGLPTHGVLSVNQRRPRNLMFRTFNGIDIQAIAVLGSIATEIGGLTSLSWSIHREKRKMQVLGRSQAKTRSKGARTIAGTMVFIFSDQHPLAEIFPSKLQKVNPQSKADQDQWMPIVMTDEIPPFDLQVLLTNEYGFATFFTIYGIDISDEGTVVSTDSALTEVVMQYTAISIDPVMQMKPDENGNYDIFGLLSNDFFNYWTRREKAAAGVLNTDLEEAFERHQDELYGKYRAIKQDQYRERGKDLRLAKYATNEKNKEDLPDDTKNINISPTFK